MGPRRDGAASCQLMDLMALVPDSLRKAGKSPLCFRDEGVEPREGKPLPELQPSTETSFPYCWALIWASGGSLHDGLPTGGTTSMLSLPEVPELLRGLKLGGQVKAVLGPCLYQ